MLEQNDLESLQTSLASNELGRPSSPGWANTTDFSQVSLDSSTLILLRLFYSFGEKIISVLNQNVSVNKIWTERQRWARRSAPHGDRE